MNKKEVMDALEICKNGCSGDGCLYLIDCNPLNCESRCFDQLAADALELLKEQEAIIEQYHKADAFLDAHGWKWK